MVVAFILAVSLLPAGSFAALGIAWTALILAAVVSSIGPLRMVRGSLVALPFAAAALPLLFTRSGDPMGTLDLGPISLTLSGEGLRLVLTIMLKSWVSVQAATLLVFTTPFHDLLEGLARLKMPALMVAVISLMYRYLAVLTGEASRMMRARASRAAVLPGSRRPGAIWQARVVGNMVGALFIRSYERSERVYLAMQSRGYTGNIRHIHDHPFSRVQALLLVASIAMLAAFEVTAHAWLPHS